MPPILRDYQLDVLARGRARLADGVRRLLIQAPTGAGKTHISSEMTRCAAAKGKRVLFLAHRRRLIQQKSERLDMFGVPHGVIMQGVSPMPCNVQIASRDTLLSRAVRNEWIEFPPADLVIVDECRHCLADQYQELLARYRGAVIVGLDATPTLPDGRGLGAYYQALECTVPVSRLIADGHLVPVRCFAPESSDKDGLAGDPVTHWKAYAQGRPTVLFANRIESSLAAVDAFRSADVPAEHIDAHTEDEEREAIVNRLECGETMVVCNVGIWTEGVDIPLLSCCQILRACGSATLFAQMVGRVMRPHGNKKDAVLIDHAGAVFQHGFPDEDVEWSLDVEDSVDARIQKAKDQGQRKEPVCCPKCAALFSGTNVCPNCSFVCQKRNKREEREDELLVEVKREQLELRKPEDMKRYWLRCLGIAKARNQSFGAAAAMYHSHYKEWPARDWPGREHSNKAKVADLMPDFGKRKTEEAAA